MIAFDFSTVEKKGLIKLRRFSTSIALIEDKANDEFILLLWTIHLLLA